MRVQGPAGASPIAPEVQEDDLALVVRELEGDAVQINTFDVGGLGPDGQAFAFGDTSATTLGVNVPATRWIMLTAAALLTGAMVSVP